MLNKINMNVLHCLHDTRERGYVHKIVKLIIFWVCHCWRCRYVVQIKLTRTGHGSLN